MTDIVERLRAQTEWHVEDANEAADEIERLRAALREIVDSSNDPRAVREARAALERK